MDHAVLTGEQLLMERHVSLESNFSWNTLFSSEGNFPWITLFSSESNFSWNTLFS